MLSDSSRLPDQARETEDFFVPDPFPPLAFAPQRALILTKLSRLEFEQRTHPHLSIEKLERKLEKRGSDVERLKERHEVHRSYLKTITREIELRGIETKVCQRWEFKDDLIAWADVIFTAGGDGTFLLAASKVRSGNIPVIGINTDPLSSEGYLCLQKKLPETQFRSALDRLLSGDFKWLWRMRIRISMTGKQQDPIELHNQQLLYPEHRWSEHVHEMEEERFAPHKARLRSRSSVPPDFEEMRCTTPCSNHLLQPPEKPKVANGSISPLGDDERLLPFFALNDVFIGESLSARVSYYELRVDGGAKTKQKSSGLTVCTGTGSTSWYFNINKMTEHCVSDILQLTKAEAGSAEIPLDEATVANVCRKFNSKLIFHPSDPRLAYAVRDSVFNATFAPVPPRGFAQKIWVKSRCFDAQLVVDGGMSWNFNDGSKVLLEVHPQDALRTVVFRD